VALQCIQGPAINLCLSALRFHVGRRFFLSFLLSSSFVSCYLPEQPGKLARERESKKTVLLVDWEQT
jgi:hypothetical protein